MTRRARSLSVPRPSFPDLLSLLMPADCALCGAALHGQARGGPRPEPGLVPVSASEYGWAPGSSPSQGSPPGRTAAPSLGRAPLCPDCAASLAPIREPRCPACGKGLVSESGRCMRCRKREWAFDTAVPLFTYEGAAASLVLAYKIGGRRSLGPFLASLLEREFLARWPGLCLVPVPPRPGKIRERGWDQVEELARLLERRGLRVERALERRISGEQKRFDLVGRFANAAGAYVLKSGVRPAGGCVLLDDVLTTGATLEACSRALLGGGAASVSALVVAAD